LAALIVAQGAAETGINGRTAPRQGTAHDGASVQRQGFQDGIHSCQIAGSAEGAGMGFSTRLWPPEVRGHAASHHTIIHAIIRQDRIGNCQDGHITDQIHPAAPSIAGQGGMLV
jgi:hypothetical protein